MKLAIWLCFAFFTLAWTGLVWVASALTRRAGELVESGAAVDWATAAGNVSFPAWLTWWIDPSLIESIMDGVVWSLQVGSQAMPWFNSVAGWLVAALWACWFGGTLLLLLVAAGLHALAGRSAAKRPL